MNMNANRVTWVSIKLAPTPRLACGAKFCSEWVDTTPNCLTGRIASTCTTRGRRRRRPDGGLAGAGGPGRAGVSRIALTGSAWPFGLIYPRARARKLTESFPAPDVVPEEMKRK